MCQEFEAGDTSRRWYDFFPFLDKVTAERLKQWSWGTGITLSTMTISNTRPWCVESQKELFFLKRLPRRRRRPSNYVSLVRTSSGRHPLLKFHTTHLSDIIVYHLPRVKLISLDDHFFVQIEVDGKIACITDVQRGHSLRWKNEYTWWAPPFCYLSTILICG